MIYLQTGLPGHGKTLYTIAYVKDMAEKEHRPVFYSGIKDLALDWQEIEPEKWMECPTGAIIVIDECQRLFRPRGNGSKVPDFVSKLETHRHQGFDIFLVTQHPMLIDANVRRLTERHSHISRRFGLQRSSIFQFESCKDQPLTQVASAQRIEWKYPKDIFSYYKSAEVHTVKRRLPAQIFVATGAIVLAIALIWYFVQRHYSDGKYIVPGFNDTEQKQLESKKEKTELAGSPGRTSDKPKPMTQAEFIDMHRPRVEGLAYTAPIYDEITKPTEVPVPAACVQSKSKGCRCYSQQATRLEMPESLCQQIVTNGFFQAFDNNKNRVAEQRPEPRSQSNVVSNDQRSVPITAGSLGSVSPPPAPVSGNDSMNPRFNVALRGNP